MELDLYSLHYYNVDLGGGGEEDSRGLKIDINSHSVLG